MSKSVARPKRKSSSQPGRGRAFAKTDAQSKAAEMLFGLGATIPQVAKQLGLGKSTIERHFQEEAKAGWELANLQLYGALWKKAVKGGDTACLIFLAKNRLGMRDRFPDDQPAPIAPGNVTQNIMVRLELRPSTDPRALKPPPADRLPQLIEAKAEKAA